MGKNTYPKQHFSSVLKTIPRESTLQLSDIGFLNCNNVCKSRWNIIKTLRTAPIDKKLQARLKFIADRHINRLTDRDVD